MINQNETGSKNLLGLFLYDENEDIVTDWTVSRKRIGKHVPKFSRIDAHSYATVLVV
jgi:hypothetical protein